MNMDLDDAASLYLYATDGVLRQVREDAVEASMQVGRLLLENDWVEIRRWGVKAKTRWTVMERSETGVPTSVVCEWWHGELTANNLKRRE